VQIDDPAIASSLTKDARHLISRENSRPRPGKRPANRIPQNEEKIRFPCPLPKANFGFKIDTPVLGQEERAIPRSEVWAMIQMKCPSCGSPLQFHESVVGTKRRCQKCKMQLVVEMPKTPHQRKREEEMPTDRQGRQEVSDS
jgi:hypothetical protein